MASPTRDPSTPRRSTRSRSTIIGGTQTPNLAPGSTRRQSARGSPSRHSRGSPSRQSARLPVQFAGLSLSSADTSLKLDNCVILEIQNRYMKAGFAGNSKELCCLNVPHGRVEGMTEQDPPCLWESEKWHAVNLERLLRHAFNQELLVDTKQLRVMIVPPSNCSIPLKQFISRVLFNRFNVSSIIFQPAAPLAVLSSGSRCGLVIDLGWEELTITPVYDLREMTPQSGSSVRGAKLLHEKTTESLYEEGTEELSFHHVDSLLKNGDLRDPAQTALKRSVEDVLFATSQDGHDDDNELSVVDLATKVLNRLGIETRGAVSENIMFTGIYGNIKGLKSTIIERIRAKRGAIRGIKTLGYWAGASLYVSSIEWCLVHDDRSRFPGEIPRDRFDERWLMEEIII